MLTRRIWSACQLVDIPLLDHIVIGDHRYVSFREEGLLWSGRDAGRMIEGIFNSC